MIIPNDVAQINAAMARWSETVGRTLFRFAVPIYADGPRHPRLIGTGTLMSLRGKVVLATAAHVFDDATAAPRYVGAAEMLLPFGGRRWMSLIPSGGTRDDDPVDLAVVQLAPEAANHVDLDDCLLIDDLDIAEPSHAAESDFFFVNGFPATRQPRQMRDAGFEARAFPFVTEEAAESEYAEAGISRTTSLLVHFDKDDIYRAGQLAAGPDLPGTSGGPVWRLPSAPRERPRLAGLVVRWRLKPPLGIIARRASSLNRLIAHAIATPSWSLATPTE
jgi:hypothetical protein